MCLKCSLLFSGGKDSSLAAIILSKIFEVELITVTFGRLENWKKAQKVAVMLKFPFRVLYLSRTILEAAGEIVVRDGYPKNGIGLIHKKALEAVAQDRKLIADGTRREDRVPILSLAEIKSFEDKFKIHYIQPLIGYSKKTINLLTDRYFFTKEYNVNCWQGAEYEFELREFIREKYGSRAIKKLFPQNHFHSIVKGLKIPLLKMDSL